MLKMNKKLLIYVLVFATSHSVLCPPSSPAATVVEPPRSSGVWCERRSDYAISKAHEIRLAQSLRRVTGFADLHFNPDGSLSLGDAAAVAGGSAEARRILIKAVCSGVMFIIEDYSGSRSVIFGQAAPERVYETGDDRESQVWRLRLDFDDFQQIEAPSEVRAAFDEGFTLLHELLHGLGYEDAIRERDLGACEEIVNRMRSELGLPLRDQYFGDAWRITEKITSVRLRFRSYVSNGSSSRRGSNYLFFLLTESAESSTNARVGKRVETRSRNSLHVTEPQR